MKKIIYIISIVLSLWITDLKAEADFNYLGKDIYHLWIGSNTLALKPKDLINLNDLANLKDNDYSVFGIGLPKRIILEVFEFGTKHNDEFSAFVKKYPFAQLIFSQWLTIKLYERHKELTKNYDLKYKEFLETNFNFVFENKVYNLYEAIDKIKTQELKYKNEKDYSPISTLVAMTDETSITLYDFIYDIIPNSIRKVFLKDEESLKAYLPLKQEEFFYKEVEYENPEYVFRPLFNFDEKELPKGYEKKVPKEYYLLNALSLKNYAITDKSLSIPKAKTNKLGIGYDELWELVSQNEKDLKYPKLWEFKDIPAPELQEYDTDEHGDKYPLGEWRKYVPDYKFQSSWKDIIRLQQDYAPYGDYLTIYNGENWDRGVAYISSDKIVKTAAKQYFDSKALIMQNNFHTEYKIFETLRQKLRENDELSLDPAGLGTRAGCAESCFEAARVEISCQLAYRFNQALALAFLNAYDK